MADKLKAIYTGTLTASNATLYTVPASTQAIVTEIICANKTGTAATVSFRMGGFYISLAKPVAANDTVVFSLHTVLEAGKLLEASASAAATIDVYISGIEIS